MLDHQKFKSFSRQILDAELYCPHASGGEPFKCLAWQFSTELRHNTVPTRVGVKRMTQIQPKKKSRSRTRVVVASVAALFLAVIAIGLFYQYLLPFINKNAIDHQPVLIWQGTITDKKMELQVDHEAYSLQINGTVWKTLDNQAMYAKYDNGSYVYYISIPDGTHVLTTDPSMYLV